MFKSPSFFTTISLSLGVFSIATFASASLAQSNKVNFNQAQCIQGLVKEGLKADQATVWCNYNRECLIRSQKEGLPPDAAKSVCDCSIKEFRKKYSPEKFKELTKQADSNPKVAKELREVGEACFEKILYEE